jgi:hypothetical protein
VEADVEVIGNVFDYFEQSDPYDVPRRYSYALTFDPGIGHVQAFEKSLGGHDWLSRLLA